MGMNISREVALDILITLAKKRYFWTTAGDMALF